MARRGVLLSALLAGLLVLSPLVAPAFAAGSYDIDVDGSIDTAERNVTVDGDSFTVTAVGTLDRGETITATVAAPAGASYDLYLYDSDRRVTDAAAMDGSGSAEFETDYLSPGTYVVAVYTSEGSIAAVQPVVVSGYEIGADAATRVSAETSPSVDVTLTETGDAPEPERVEVVVLQDGSVATGAVASPDGDGYVASLPADLSAGDYRYYVAVRGPNEVNDRHELVALSEARRLRVGSADGSAGSDGADSNETTRAAADTSTTSAPPTSTVMRPPESETSATGATTAGVITPT
jgi:hypothetical protein